MDNLGSIDNLISATIFWHFGSVNAHPYKITLQSYNEAGLKIALPERQMDLTPTKDSLAQ